MITRRKILSASIAGLGISVLGTPQTALSQTAKITRVIVGFPPGGGTDVAARSLVDKMQSAYPAGIIVENKPGASGRLAVENVKNSLPDGNTMLFTTDFPITIYPHSFRKLNYDPIKDFVPVAVCAKTSLAFTIGPSVPESVKTLADFVAWAKANPKLAAYATSSAGATPHFAGVMFNKSAGLDMLHVPYKGGAPALQDLMGGQIASSFPGVGEVLPQLSSGKLRVLATTGAHRSRFMPNIPTMIESGYKDVVAEVWLGVLMPANTPPAVVAKAAAVINEALKTSELKDTLGRFGMDALQGTPESFAALIKADLAAWGPTIKASGFTAED